MLERHMPAPYGMDRVQRTVLLTFSAVAMTETVSGKIFTVDSNVRMFSMYLICTQ